MIKQFKTAVVTAIVVGMMGSVASPVYAAEKAKRPVSCRQEAKKAGITDKKELRKYEKECKHKRYEARKAARKEAKLRKEKELRMKKAEQKREQQKDKMQKDKPAQ
ncbi:MAG: hypothetical protein P8076_13040 [Gammaproteobacteria bacterium]